MKRWGTEATPPPVSVHAVNELDTFNADLSTERRFVELSDFFDSVGLDSGINGFVQVLTYQEDYSHFDILQNYNTIRILNIARELRLVCENCRVIFVMGERIVFIELEENIIYVRENEKGNLYEGFAQKKDESL